MHRQLGPSETDSGGMQPLFFFLFLSKKDYQKEKNREIIYFRPHNKALSLTLMQQMPIYVPGACSLYGTTNHQLFAMSSFCLPFQTFFEKKVRPD
jgi:hypothetical protein